MRADPLYIPTVLAVAIEPSFILAQAFNDPDVSTEEYAALARSIYGDDDGE